MFVGLLVIVVTVCLIVKVLSRQQLLPSPTPSPERRSTVTTTDDETRLATTISPDKITTVGSKAGGSQAQFSASGVARSKAHHRRRKIKPNLI